MQLASANPALLAKSNGGRPAIAATPRPGAFNEPGVVGAHGATPVAMTHGAQPGHPGTPGQPYGAHPQGSGQPYGSHPPHAPPGPNGTPANVNGAKPAKQHPKEAPEGQRHEPETAAK